MVLQIEMMVLERVLKSFYSTVTAEK